jgi:hypothetical protein
MSSRKTSKSTPSPKSNSKKRKPETEAETDDGAREHKQPSKRAHALGVHDIVSDNLTAIGLEYWAGDESTRKPFDPKVRNVKKRMRLFYTSNVVLSF